MSDLAVIDPRDITITPVFKIIEVEDVNASERAGHLVKKTKEVVEVRFAGSRNYSPVFPVDAVYRREGNRSITYAERWGDAYRQFKNGDEQQAQGTPLEMLGSQGITPAQVSLCRTLKIYSIEALHSLEGERLKSLGMNANRLKDAARAFMSERQTLSGAASEIEALKAQIAELQRASTQVPEKEASEKEVQEALEAADNEFVGMTDEQLKEEIADIAGSKPRGNPSRVTLETNLRDLREAAAA